jgi:hypothetical protein
MDKFSGLYVKSNGEWALHGQLLPDPKPHVDAIRAMTDAKGKIKSGKTEIQAEAAAVIHSTKGVLQSRKF